MRTNTAVLASAVVAIWATGCTKPPTAEFDAAKASVQAASIEGATYAPDALKAARDAEAQLDAELKVQSGKFGIVRSYDRARELAASAEVAADRVQTAMTAEKERLRAETDRIVAEAKRQLEDAQSSVEKVPRADAPVLKTDAAVARTSLEEVSSLLADGQLVKAHHQAEAALQAVEHVTTAIEHAQAELAAARARGAASGEVQIPRAVLADGKPLSAGAYRVRLTKEQSSSVVGETPGSERWIEFVRNGTVAGRALAIVVSADEIGTLAKGQWPRPNDSRVDVLKGGEYVRVWLNRGGMNYLAHLPLAPRNASARPNAATS